MLDASFLARPSRFPRDDGIALIDFTVPLSAYCFRSAASIFSEMRISLSPGFIFFEFDVFYTLFLIYCIMLLRTKYLKNSIPRANTARQAKKFSGEI